VKNNRFWAMYRTVHNGNVATFGASGGSEPARAAPKMGTDPPAQCRSVSAPSRVPTTCQLPRHGAARPNSGHPLKCRGQPWSTGGGQCDWVDSVTSCHQSLLLSTSLLSPLQRLQRELSEGGPRQGVSGPPSPCRPNTPRSNTPSRVRLHFRWAEKGWCRSCLKESMPHPSAPGPTTYGWMPSFKCNVSALPQRTSLQQKDKFLILTLPNGTVLNNISGYPLACPS